MDAQSAPDLVRLAIILEEAANRLRFIDQYQIRWVDRLPPSEMVQDRADPSHDCAACGLPIAIGQTYWSWNAPDGRVTHTGPIACATTVFGLLRLAGATWGLIR